MYFFFFFQDRSSLELIVFLAIMLHKAPSSFSLVTHLLAAHTPRRMIRNHLFLFSMAAPIGSIMTYLTLSQVGWKDEVGMKMSTAVMLLFSAGTFLYVATVHVFPEIYQSPSGGGGVGDEEEDDEHTHSERQRLSKAQIVVLVVGVFVPYFLMLKV
jgi:zinc transporter 9